MKYTYRYLLYVQMCEYSLLSYQKSMHHKRRNIHIEVIAIQVCTQHTNIHTEVIAIQVYTQLQIVCSTHPVFWSLCESVVLCLLVLKAPAALAV